MDGLTNAFVLLQFWYDNLVFLVVLLFVMNFIRRYLLYCQYMPHILLLKMPSLFLPFYFVLFVAE